MLERARTQQQAVRQKSSLLCTAATPPPLEFLGTHTHTERGKKNLIEKEEMGQPGYRQQKTTKAPVKAYRGVIRLRWFYTFAAISVDSSTSIENRRFILRLFLQHPHASWLQVIKFKSIPLINSSFLFCFKRKEKKKAVASFQTTNRKSIARILPFASTLLLLLLLLLPSMQYPLPARMISFLSHTTTTTSSHICLSRRKQKTPQEKQNCELGSFVGLMA